jgi:hypothetical protein
MMTICPDHMVKTESQIYIWALAARRGKMENRRQAVYFKGSDTNASQPLLLTFYWQKKKKLFTQTSPVAKNLKNMSLAGKLWV